MSMWTIKYSEVIMGRSHQRGVNIVATLKGRVSGICFVWSGLPHKMLVIDDTGKLPLVFSGVHVYSFPSFLECPIVPKMKKKNDDLIPSHNFIGLCEFHWCINFVWAHESNLFMRPPVTVWIWMKAGQCSYKLNPSHTLYIFSWIIFLQI